MTNTTLRDVKKLKKYSFPVARAEWIRGHHSMQFAGFSVP